ncbi:MAG: hypothetical protein M1827_000340 [Pycnora praestabilis]|nr:MAG: hypothetical protein M1827_000340 [Pycnora praestabilis]
MSSARRFDIGNVKSIAIIGAGPGGLAVAKYLLAERAFDKLDIFDQCADIGGVWIYTPDIDKGPKTVPQINPHAPIDDPVWRDVGTKHGDKEMDSEPAFPSPMYDKLETNIPHFLMQYSDKPFPKDTQLFPKRENVTEYLEEYAADFRNLIKFQTQVLDVRLRSVDSRDLWSIRSRQLQSGKQSEEDYDAVVVANGHYNVPYVPDIQGISSWNDRYPDIISHSKFYRRPRDFTDKKVIVVGNAASGLDIGTQISDVCRAPILVSQHSTSYLSPGPSPLKEEVPPIVEFLPSSAADRGVRFADGRIEEGIDAIVFCTGYFYSYPFLESLKPAVVTDGLRTEHTYQHMFYIPHPTLAFVGLPQKIIPFPLSEGYGAVLARVWSGRLALPPQEAMYDWEDEIVQARGTGKKFHTLMFPLDVEFINELHDWSVQAERREGLENDGKGKMPPRWTEETRWYRERFPALKKAFADKGKDRRGVLTAKELGFDYEEWKRENSVGARSLL